METDRNQHEHKKEKIQRALEKINELGRLFSLCYIHAISDYPELIQVDIEIGNEEKYPVLRKTGGFARHQSQTDRGRPLVVIGNKGVKHYETLLKTRKMSSEMCAQILNIPKEKLTPKILASFIFLHEIGHGYDYLINMPTKEEYKAKRDAEMKTLPVSGYNPAFLAEAFESETSSLSIWYEENKKIIAKNGYASKSELLLGQERAYHSLETEKFPDTFAAKIILKNREDFLSEIDNHE